MISQGKIYRNVFSKRLKEFRESLGLSQKDFADKIGESQPNVSRYESGTEPKISYLAKIAKVYNQEIFFLLTGEEPPLKAAEAPEIIFNITNGARNVVDVSGEYAAINLLKDAVAAGSPAEINEYDVDNRAIIYNDRTWMPHGADNYTCVRVRGKSMYPVLNDGDIVAIDHAERPTDLANLKRLDGKMVAFKIDGGVTIKWLKFREEQEVVIGIPENHTELDHIVILRGDEIYEGIVGLVRWWWSKR